MKNIIFLLATTALIGCEKNIGKNTPEFHSPVVLISETKVPYTGTLNIFPMAIGGQSYVGNYVNSSLSAHQAVYNMSRGSSTEGDPALSLPGGSYDLLYYGETNEGVYPTTGLISPSPKIGDNLWNVSFFTRPNVALSDTTFMPVPNLAFAHTSIQIGRDSLQADMQRAVAGVKVNIKTSDGSAITDEITKFQVHIYGSGERLNLYTARAGGKPISVGFDIPIAASRKVATNLPAMMFPTVIPVNSLRLFIYFKNSPTQIITSSLKSALIAGNTLNLNVTLQVAKSAPAALGVAPNQTISNVEIIESSDVSLRN